MKINMIKFLPLKMDMQALSSEKSDDLSMENEKKSVKLNMMKLCLLIMGMLR